MPSLGERLLPTVANKELLSSDDEAEKIQEKKVNSEAIFNSI
jgi:hypothetical protein